MRKIAVAVFGFSVAFATSFLYYYAQSGDISIVDYLSWLKSFFRRVSVVTTNKAKEVVGQSNYLEKAVTIIAGFETFSAKAYPDADGFSIGYGHFILPGDPYNRSSIISEDEAWALLLSDVQVKDSCISQNVTVSLNDNQRAALLSLVYNIGCGAFRNSTLLRLLNNGDYEGAAQQFDRWKFSRGKILAALIDRRTEERGLFNS